MNDQEFKSVFKEENFSEEKQANYLKEINNEVNKTVAKYKDEIEQLKSKVKSFETTENDNNVLKQKLFISRNINNELDEESIDDLLTIAKKRVSDQCSEEEAIKQAAMKYNFVKKNVQSQTIVTTEAPKAEAPKVEEAKQPVEEKNPSQKVGTPSFTPQQTVAEKSLGATYQDRQKSKLGKFFTIQKI